MSGDRAAEVALREVRGRIASLVKAHPDSSHGEDYRNGGVEMALRVLDLALDAPCEFHPTAYGSWCELHFSPVDAERPIVDGRCPSYHYTAARVLVVEDRA